MLSLISSAFLTFAASQVDVTVTINQCPTVEWFMAGPLDLYLGGEASFEMRAKDKDKNPITYVWVESHGSSATLLGFGTKAKFKCTERGSFMVRGWAHDGHCAAMAEAEVRCYNLDE